MDKQEHEKTLDEKREEFLKKGEEERLSNNIETAFYKVSFTGDFQALKQELRLVEASRSTKASKAAEKALDTMETNRLRRSDLQVGEKYNKSLENISQKKTRQTSSKMYQSLDLHKQNKSEREQQSSQKKEKEREKEKDTRGR